MKRKPILVIGMLLFLNLFMISCSAKQVGSASLTLEQSITEIIISKGEGYDFLNDEAYMSHMDKLGQELTINKLAKPPHYAIGNLDEDNIPELVVFKERNTDDVDDEGSLEVYKFNKEEYLAIDSISMNYDNTNYQIVIGKISKDQNGILLNNQVGAHSGITYGFILQDEKLKDILNDKKVSLISIYTSNEIKDLDNDGILEFSVYLADPESEEQSSVGSDKMTLWYRWNGKDSADLIEVERIDHSNIKSDKKIFEQGKEIIDYDFSHALSFVHQHKDALSKFDNTELLMEYIKKLDTISPDKGMEVDNLFVKYQTDKNFDYLFTKYGLSIEKLNSIEYLKREKVLKDELELKQNILDNIDLGYKLHTSEGMYYYLINNQIFVDSFSGNITNEYSDYLKILALDTNEPSMNDGGLIISMRSLAERTLLVENFKMIYQYSNLLPRINEIYTGYMHTYLYGDNHNPNFDYNTFVMKDESLKEFEKAIEKYEYTNFADIIRDFMQLLKENNNMINDKIREKLDEKLK